MKVVHITSAHPPFDTRVFHKECRTLADAGHDVTLVVPGGPDEVVDGVTLLGIPKPTSRWSRVFSTQRHLFDVARGIDPDVVHFHDPDLLILGMILARRHAVVYDSHEDVVRQVRGRRWIPSPLRRPVARSVRAIEWLAVRQFARVISAEPGGLDRFPAHKRALVQNFPLREELDQHEQSDWSSRSTVFYVGDIVRARGAVQMVDAIGMLPRELGVRFVLAGRVNEPGLEDELRASAGWARTDYLGFIDRETLARCLRDAMVGLVVMQPIEQYRDATQPVKLFEYLGAGVPVVASNFGSWRPFVEEIEGGIQVDPRDVAAIAGAIEKLVSDPARAEQMGRQGRAAVLERWTWDTERDSLLSVYESLSTR